VVRQVPCTLRVTIPPCISLVDPRSRGGNPWARMGRDETIPSLAIGNLGNASRGRGVD
jgi:hypothetical protein